MFHPAHTIIFGTSFVLRFYIIDTSLAHWYRIGILFYTTVTLAKTLGHRWSTGFIHHWYIICTLAHHLYIIDTLLLHHWQFGTSLFMLYHHWYILGTSFVHRWHNISMLHHHWYILGTSFVHRWYILGRLLVRCIIIVTSLALHLHMGSSLETFNIIGTSLGHFICTLLAHWPIFGTLYHHRYILGTL